MPVYECPKCGRIVEKPEGKYYCVVCGQSYYMRKASRKRLETVANDLVDEVYNEIHYWCWNVSPDPASECFLTHATMDLYELAGMYIREGVDEKLAILSELPKDIYDKHNKRLQTMLEREARAIERRYGKTGTRKAIM